MKEQLEEAAKRHQAHGTPAASGTSASAAVSAGTSASTATGTASTTVTPLLVHKFGATGPNLKEIERNNKLRTVEAHLFATIANNPLPVAVKPPAAFTPSTNTQGATVKVGTAAQAQDVVLAASLSKAAAIAVAAGAGAAVSGATVAKRGVDSAPHSRSGSFSYSAKSMKPHTQVGLAQSQQAQAQAAAAAPPAPVPAAKSSVVQRDTHKTAKSAAAPPSVVTPPAGAPWTVTAAVEAHMAGTVAPTQPADLALFDKHKQSADKNRTAVTAEIRRRALERRRGWEMLGDAYLEVQHKWNAHVEQVEKEEGGFKEGPKLRGSLSTGHFSTPAFGIGNFSGSLPSGLTLPSSLAGLSGRLSAEAAGLAGDGAGSGLGTSVSTRSFDMAAASSRASGLGIARSDYEQVSLSVHSSYIIDPTVD
jgi:hypothetical protein